MPYKLRKAPKRDLYWVIAQDGKHMSKEPIPKERAEAQIRALYASERQQKGGSKTRPSGDEYYWNSIYQALRDKIRDLADRGILARSVADAAIARGEGPAFTPEGITELDCDAIWNEVIHHIKPLAAKAELNSIHTPDDHTGLGRGGALHGGAGNRHSLHGAGPIPELSVLQQIAKAAYSTSPPQEIGPFVLRNATPTLKFYVLKDPDDARHIDTVIVGIRGTNTSDKQDLYADAKLALGQLGDTPRWTKDLADFNSFMNRIPNPKAVDVYGVGHSLGGAVLDMFLKAGLIKKGVSYNPAISMGDAQKDIPNRRIYQEGDPLLAIMGRSARNVEIRPQKKKEQSVGRRIANAASYFIPYVGLVTKGMDTLDAHALDNFTGGYTSKVQDKPDVIDRLEDIAVVRRSKGYYVYANDPETRAAKRWGPFTKKVAEFEKKLLHQRQRHHLQPIAEGLEGEGGMRGGAHTQQQQEWINYLNQTLTREGKLIIPEHRDRYPSEVFILDFAKNSAAYDVTREGGLNSQHTIRLKRGLPPPPIYAPPLPPLLLRAPPRRPPPPPQTEEIDDPLGVTKNLGLGRGSGKDDLDFPVVRKGDKRVELSGPRTAAMMNQRRREKAEAERRIREEAERQEAVRIARQRQIDASDEERQRERRRAESRSKVTGFGQSAYLRQAKAKAKAYGLDPKKLKVATDGKHKLSYDGVLFGATRYGDHLLWSAEEKAGRVPKGTAEKKRTSYRARAMKIKGEWKDNKVSPNNLAIHILW